MANRYWVYNGGNINDTTHWSATSGGAGGASKPTLSDNVIFDANSFTLNSQVVTLNEAFNCLSIDWTGLSKTVTFSSSVYSLNLYGNLTLAANLTWLFTGTAYLNHKASGTVTTNGIILNANRIYFDAAGITVTNGDAANYGVASFYLANGTWNTNGKTITSTGSFNTVAGTKTLTLGASVFNIGTWTNAITAGFTFNYNTSTVVITTASILTVVTTFYNLTCSGVATLTLANNITVTNALTLAGASVSNRLKILSSVAGTQRTVTVPAAGVFPSNLDVQDMAFPNAVDMSAISGYSQDFGNNTGITFTASANLFFKHTSGAANWGDITKWFLADRVTQGRIPLIQDDVNFDNLSFAGTSTLTLNILATCRSMNWTGLNQAVTLSSAVNSLKIYGHTTLATGLVWTFTGTAYTNMCGLGSFNITTNGVIPTLNYLYFDRVGGTWTCQDDLNIGGSVFVQTNGTWNTNGFTIRAYQYTLSSGDKYLILGASNLYITTGFGYGSSLSGNWIVTSGTSKIWCGNFQSFYSNLVFYDISTVTASIGTNTFTCHIFEATGNILFRAISTLTVASFIFKGTIAARSAIDVQITPRTKIVAAAITMEYADIYAIEGSGTANWNVSNIPGGSGDLGNNVNITFTSPKTVYYVSTALTCKWVDDNWKTTSGGSISITRPLPQDLAIFDTNSFVGITNFTLALVISSIDMSLVNYAVTLILTSETICSKDFILGPNISIALGYGICIRSSTNVNVHMYDKTLTALRLLPIANTITLLSGFTTLDICCVSNRYLSINGTVDFNDVNCSMSYFVFYQYQGAATIMLGNGTFTITGTKANATGANYAGDVIVYGQWSVIAGTVIPEGSTIKLLGVTTNDGGFEGGGKTYNKIWLSGTHTGYHVFRQPALGTINTINELIIDPGRKVQFTAATTTNIGQLTAIGTQANPITIGSTTAATHNLIKTGADMVEVEYCNISNSNATPSDKWSGGDTSVDGGGNSGWTFKFIPIIMWFFGIFSKK